MEKKIEKPVSTLSEAIIAIKMRHDYLRLPIKRIAFCKANGSYSELNLDNGTKIIVSKSLCDIENRLKDSDFVRCHNTFLVNANKIQKFNLRSRTLLVSNHYIPVSRRKYHQTIKKLKSLDDQL